MYPPNWPYGLATLQVLVTLLAPLQWASLVWYVRKLEADPSRLASRIVPWGAATLLCVLIPVWVYIANRRRPVPDTYLKMIAMLEAACCIALLLFKLRKDSKARGARGRGQ